MQNNISHTEIEDLIVRYFSESLTDEELHSLLSTIKADAEAARQFRNYARIKQSVVETQVDYKKPYNDFLRKTKSSKSKTRSLYIAVSAIAAVALVIFAITFLFKTQSSPSTIQIAAVPTISDTFLPDSSHISINKNTDIRYAENFAQNRHVTMQKGEAYFEVTADSLHPFVVETPQAQVTVLGTGFNVKIDSVTQNVTVTVLHGKVRIAASSQTSPQYVLTANQTSVLDSHNARFSQPQSANHNELSWKTNELVFNSTPISEVVSALNNHFGTHIEIEGKNLEACRLNASFPNPKLENIIEMLKIAFDIEIINEKDKQILKGFGC